MSTTWGASTLHAIFIFYIIVSEMEKLFHQKNALCNSDDDSGNDCIPLASEI